MLKLAANVATCYQVHPGMRQQGTNNTFLFRSRAALGAPVHARLMNIWDGHH
jgi:hypothetical protein